MVAAYTKDQFLSYLQELQIEFVRYDHPAVMTVDAQAKYVGHMEGSLIKNLFLKDKKQRYYIVSALAGTTVDLKVLSQRLGLGKGGLRMAPEDSMHELLKVPLGSVTPFALINESARCVSLLLDQEFKGLQCCLFHPLSNDTTISLSSCSLDKFLVSIGRNPAYIDLKAAPLVGKDQPPDLAAHVPSEAPAAMGQPGKAVTKQAPAGNCAAVVDKPADSAKTYAISQPPQAKRNEAKQSNSLTLQSTVSDARKLIDEVIEKTAVAVLSEVTRDFPEHKNDRLVPILCEVRKRIGSDLESLTTSFKNAAYTEGFHSGIKSILQRHL